MGDDLVTTGAIDCDVHPHFRRGLQDLAEYVDGEAWKHRLGLQKQGDGWREIPGASAVLPQTSFINPGGPLRLDATPPDGGPPASDPEFTREDLLDRFDLAAAVLLCGNLLGIGGMTNGRAAAEIASAHNRWLADVWLDADPRFKGSIVVAPHDGERAAREVATWAGHDSMVQVFIPDRVGLLLGHHSFYPIYEIAEEYGLVIAIHPGGASAGVNLGGGAFAGGVPSTFFEYHVSMTGLPQSHLVNLVSEGVFERFPRLRVALVEAGFAWLPHILWALDMNWKSFREEVPWVKRMPSEYVLEHVRVTTQPLYEPARRSDLASMLELMHAEQTLMFSTDYPHYDADLPTRVARDLPAIYREPVMRETAHAFYRENAGVPV